MKIKLDFDLNEGAIIEKSRNNSLAKSSVSEIIFSVFQIKYIDKKMQMMIKL